MSKRGIRNWAYKGIREPQPPAPNWVIISVVLLIIAVIALKTVGII